MTETTAAPKQKPKPVKHFCARFNAELDVEGTDLAQLLVRGRASLPGRELLRTEEESAWRSTALTRDIVNELRSRQGLLLNKAWPAREKLMK